METRCSILNTVLAGLVFLSGCGDCVVGDYERSRVAQLQNGGDCVVTGSAVSIEELHSPNHNFTSIPSLDVTAGVETSYALPESGSGHSHVITLGIQDFDKLRNAQGVRVRSTGADGHAHYATIHCL